MRRSDWRPLIGQVLYHFEQHDAGLVHGLGLDSRTTHLLKAYLSHWRSVVRQRAEPNR